MILEQYPRLTEKEKITIIVTKLGGAARQIAEKCGRIVSATLYLNSIELVLENNWCCSEKLNKI